MSQSRTRTRNQFYPFGSWVYAPGTTAEHENAAGVIENVYEICKDVIKKEVRIDNSMPPSNLELRRFKDSIVTVAGTKGEPPFHYVFKGNYLGGHRPSWNDLYYSEAERTHDAYWHHPAPLMLRVLAESNPFRPEVSIPVLVSELIEATSLLRLRTKNLLTLSGSAHLNINFGWLTLLRDIRTLSTIIDLLESRIKEFESLYKAGGLRRKIQLLSATDQADRELSFDQFAGIGKQRYLVSRSIKIWGSVRWKRVDANGNIASNTTRRSPITPSQVLKQILDLEKLDPHTVWEMVPFSWLIDYFRGVGDYFGAIESSPDLVRIEPFDICYMAKRTVRWTPVSSYVYDNVNAKLSATEGETTYKYRYDLTDYTKGLSWRDALTWRTPSKGAWANIAALVLVILGQRL